ncbi:hypothetical protein ACTGJ9_035525 [Bradyrhizobium sp. RDM12]
MVEFDGERASACGIGHVDPDRSQGDAGADRLDLGGKALVDGMIGARGQHRIA